jgi:hypothetical protein
MLTPIILPAPPLAGQSDQPTTPLPEGSRKKGRSISLFPLRAGQIPALTLSSARAQSRTARIHAGRGMESASRNQCVTSSGRKYKNWLASATTYLPSARRCWIETAPSLNRQTSGGRNLP